MPSLRERFTNYLNGDNIVSRLLGKAEEKTGIKKDYLAGGKRLLGGGHLSRALHLTP